MPPRDRSKRLMAAALVTLTLLSASASVTRADPGQDLKKAQDELQQLQNQQNSAQQDMETVTANATKAWQQYNDTNVQLAQAKANLARLNQSLDQTQSQLKQIQVDLDATQQKYQRQEAALGGRLRALYERGRVSYVTVLLGSTNFADFLARWDLLRAIIKQDSQMIGDLKGQQADMEAKKAKVAAQQAQLAQLKADAQVQAAAIQQKVAAQAQAVNALNAQKAEVAARIQQMEDRAQAINNQISQLSSSMAGHPMGPLHLINPLNPLPVITDPFGMRDNPILHKRTMHWGVDFGAAYGTPVLAVADGVVVHASYDSVFGNLVIIDHGQDPQGREIITWYAHNSQFKVSEGQHVKQGQVISLSGATGWATGPHVHFELHIGPDRVNGMDYLPGY